VVFNVPAGENQSGNVYRWPVLRKGGWGQMKCLNESLKRLAEDTKSAVCALQIES
jgi:hypothetical protein